LEREAQTGPPAGARRHRPGRIPVHPNTGRYLHELDSVEPARLKDYLAEMHTVIEGGRPAYARDVVTTRFGALQEIYVGIWPLATDGHTVDKLVVIEDYGALKVWQLRPDEDI
jgi:hypothetical protein